VSRPCGWAYGDAIFVEGALYAPEFGLTGTCVVGWVQWCGVPKAVQISARAVEFPIRFLMAHSPPCSSFRRHATLDFCNYF